MQKPVQSVLLHDEVQVGFVVDEGVILVARAISSSQTAEGILRVAVGENVGLEGGASGAALASSRLIGPLVWLLCDCPQHGVDDTYRVPLASAPIVVLWVIESFLSVEDGSDDWRSLVSRWLVARQQRTFGG